jgi:Ca-activated chloride channel family protein
MAWGLTTLFYAPPKVYRAQAVLAGKEEHVLIVLDVSPSMRLKDAGPEKKDSRRARALAVMESFFKRVPTEKYRLSVLAVYSSAKPVVIDTKDIDVVRSILGDLPLFQAFDTGKTKLFEGLEAAAKIAKPWNPRSTTVVLITDGDTVPAQGMPQMPPSVGSVLVVGVGDAMSGSFIDGGQSRQDVSTLRQIATRLGGHYHNGNEKHISSEIINAVLAAGPGEPSEKLTKREYALMALGLGSVLYALLPLLLHYFGTAWRPGVLTHRRQSQSRNQRRISREMPDAV